MTTHLIQTQDVSDVLHVTTPALSEIRGEQLSHVYRALWYGNEGMNLCALCHQQRDFVCRRREVTGQWFCVMGAIVYRDS